MWLALYAAVALAYVLTSTGRIGGSDALAMAHVSESLAHHASISADPCTPGPESVHCVPGVDGKHYAAYGLVPSIMAVPAAVAASVAATVAHKDSELLFGLILSLYHALFAAAVPIVLALWLYRIGISWRVAALTSLVYAFATPSWGLARGFSSEPYFAMGIVACCYFLACEPEAIFLLAAGSCFGFACASRVYGLILLPALCLYAVLLWRSKQASVAVIIRNLALFGAPVILTIGLIALSNQLRFGSVFKTGYHLLNPNTAALVSTPLLDGLKSLLIDGEVGILYYVPWILALPFLWLPFWRSRRNEAILVLCVSLTDLLFFAKYTAWHGGWSIGPRMLNAMIPFLTLSLAVAIDDPNLAWRPLARRVTLALVWLAFIIQAVLLPYPGSRYFHMLYYNTKYGLQQPWWSGQPLLAAVSSYPELFGGSINSDNSPAHQYLLTFPNSVNLVRPDLWLVKAPLAGVPASAALAVGVILLLGALYSARTALLSSPDISNDSPARTEAS